MKFPATTGAKSVFARCPSTLRRGHAQGGFTLVEILVATGILGLAVLAAMRIQGEGARTTLAVRERLLADIVGENRLVEAVTAVEEPVLGSRTGEQMLAGASWQWTETTTATAVAGLVRIDVAVRQGDDGQVLATFSAFRGRR